MSSIVMSEQGGETQTPKHNTSWIKHVGKLGVSASSDPKDSSDVPPPTTSTTTTTTLPITNANSVFTQDWNCIRHAEGSNSAGNYTQTSGAYGILNLTWHDLPSMGFSAAANYSVPGEAPPTVQNNAALFLYAKNNYHFKGTWNDYCTFEHIVY